MNTSTELDLRSYVKFRDTGEITQAGIQEARFTQADIDLGAYVAFGEAKLINDLNTYRQYVEFGGPGEFKVVDRPLVEGDFDHPEVKVGEESTFRDLPACDLQVIGPIQGAIHHDGGDLKIGFTLPGEYILKVGNAFPYFPATLFLSVGV